MRTHKADVDHSVRIIDFHHESVIVALNVEHNTVIAHDARAVGRHMDNDGDASFVDDLSLRDMEGTRRDPREAQADEWAEEALVPRAIWETSEARRNPTPMSVVNLSKALQVHPAIVAGKVRYEQRNYRLLSHFVGTGEVRRQLGLAA